MGSVQCEQAGGEENENYLADQNDGTIPARSRQSRDTERHSENPQRRQKSARPKLLSGGPDRHPRVRGRRVIVEVVLDRGRFGCLRAESDPPLKRGHLLQHS
jgi:hypothetical protein